MVLLANNVVCIEKGDICYLKDESINYNLPLTFSISEKPMVEMLAKEINFLIKSHLRYNSTIEEDYDYLNN